MTLGTRLVTTKKALVSVLGTAPAFSGVQVTYAEVIDGRWKECIYLGDTEDHESEPAAMRAGGGRREETFTVRLFVDAASSKGVEAADERSVELLQEVEKVLQADPKLSAAATPPGILWAALRGFRMTSTVHTDGGRSLIEADIEVKARP